MLAPSMPTADFQPVEVQRNWDKTEGRRGTGSPSAAFAPARSSPGTRSTQQQENVREGERVKISGQFTSAIPGVDWSVRPRVVEDSERLEAERRDLLRERSRLLNLQFRRQATARDEARLRYLDWQLQRMDIQQTGEHLEQLEAFAEREVRFAERMSDLARKVDSMLNANQRRPFSS